MDWRTWSPSEGVVIPPERFRAAAGRQRPWSNSTTGAPTPAGDLSLRSALSLRSGLSLRSALSRWDAAVLDPRATAGGPGRHAATTYRSHALVLHPTDPDTAARTRDALQHILTRRRWATDWTDHDQARLHIRSADPAAEQVDSWSVLAELRAAATPDVAAAVGLDHLMNVAEQVGGNPLALGHGRVGMDGYGSGGYAGRGPVHFVVAPPPEVAVRDGRRPRVVVLDTGLGDHPWFHDDRARTTVTMADGTVVGPQIDPSTVKAAADGAGAVENRLLGTLASHTGHGTFIAGLIRQSCPQADIVALAVMGADGMVPESTLTDALSLVAKRQREQPGWADAVVLSLGYYSENAHDAAYSSRLKNILVELGELGVAVFCAAGNDASSRPSYPAAFALDPAFARPDVLPLVSVAALNPDGSVAMFSNDGPWVIAEAPGVNLVSTAPVDTDGSSRPAIRVVMPGRRSRAVVDGDNFASGFASWSGTSFAAPVLAGRYLSAVAAAGFPSPERRRALVPVGRRNGAAAVTP